MGGYWRSIVSSTDYLAPKAGYRTQEERNAVQGHFRQEYWSVDVRYIEEHNLGFPEPVYLISVLENYSRAILASKISPTQNRWDYLEVLFAALSAFGAPSIIVSDGGGQFYSNQAMDVYAALGIRNKPTHDILYSCCYYSLQQNLVLRMVLMALQANFYLW